MDFMSDTVEVKDLVLSLNEANYIWGRPAIIIDPNEIAATFLRYEESLYLSVDREGDFEPEKLRRSLVLALHFGLKLVLDFRESADLTLSSLVDEDNFPQAIFEKEKIMDESVWKKLWKDEYQTLLDQDASVLKGSPENRVFHPSEEFQVVVVTKVEDVSQNLCADCFTIRLKDTEETEGENGKSKDGVVEKALERPPNSTELCEAAFNGDIATVMRLLDEGFDVDSREEMDNNTALSEAALQGHVDICQLLLEHWADANSLGDSGRTPLYRAAFNGHLSVVMLLLQHGADPEITDKFFQRAVDVASTREVHNVLRGWGTPSFSHLYRRQMMHVEQNNI
eukprot:TRINITY_DN202_c0_g1_i3.p3 TRINITY_DN202_c0_g1~~TRINITY_DN202_c0_g1_i3.p3  ORF type:complete len:339 (+),score=98.33 TRINITY_DN202_c0_g1_i3:93-1109(+)